MGNEVGEIRPGQLITTFGPGAIMDSVNDSLVILDIEYWQNANEKIYDKRLANFLGKDFFKKIPTKGKYDLPSIPFPNYHVCSNNKCRRLFDIREQFVIRDYLLKGPTCPDCGWKAYPSRFVVSCSKNNHLDDFPWRWWAHGKGETNCNGKMYLTSSGNSSGLASMGVKCECGEFGWQSLNSATLKNTYKGEQCTGNHPHKLNQVDKCEEDSEIIPLQRGASNVYFPALRSAISIPNYDEDINKIFEENIKSIKYHIEDNGLEQGLKKYFDREVKTKSLFKSAEDFIEKWYRFEQQDKEEINKYEQIKEIEYEAFTDFTHSKVIPDFHAVVEEVPEDLTPFFSRIVKAHRLKEVLVLLGFMRNESPEPEVKKPGSIVWLGNGTKTNWLPAVEVHGEGIFIEFNRKKLDEWINNNKNKDLFQKSEKYNQLYTDWMESKGWENQSEKDAIYVLLHTFAHVLIKQLSFQSGYSSASIKERIYYNEKMAGILVYTGSTDQEGSLGGLVEMGTISKLRKLVIDALEEATFCANDPDCSVQAPTDENHMNGASCFACTMIAETSCETGNRLLDRSLLVKTMDSHITPFFEGLI